MDIIAIKIFNKKQARGNGLWVKGKYAIGKRRKDYITANHNENA